ncbi:PREDICTED: uncharacterized protein LOC108377419 [Rhagoletis zephyria]|uniref:uncharacterized protein LOC108377419 n=1 Tax=Rhagoletis zephyria TaxID=28612 RepID=UPI0008113AFA|nr:PREDICTED: uncharacterized protein LOC108377419 [Rhagoletis zephyria]
MNAAYVKPPKPLAVDTDNAAQAWSQWHQQYTWFSVAAELEKKPAEIQVATFMTAIGPEALNIYNSFSLSDVEKKSVSTIIKKFDEYFAPKVNVTFERYSFNIMTQKSGEPFDEFLTRIKNQSRKCEFGELTDALLRDKIVCGVQSDAVREKLLSVEEITLEKAIKTCRASEAATQQLKELHKEDTEVNVLKKVKQRNAQYAHSSYSTPKAKLKQKERECRFCGYLHEENRCPAYNKSCNQCHRRGHFAKMCLSRKQRVFELTKEATPERVESEENISEDELFVNTVNTNFDTSRSWCEQIIVENRTIKVKLDSGAQCNVLLKSICNKMKIKILPATTKKLVAFNNSKVSVCGEINAKCQVRDKNLTINFKIVDGAVSPLLGKEDCERSGLILRVTELKSDDEIFSGLGCVRNYEYDIDLIPNPRFETYAARKVPHSIRDEVKKEIDKMILPTKDS